MKFTTNQKVIIKTEDGFLTLEKGDKIDLPSKYKIHPALDSEKEILIKEKKSEIVEDLKDDGKLNYSNNRKKKSPGRKKKQ